MILDREAESRDMQVPSAAECNQGYLVFLGADWTDVLVT
jgi:hypothetical protein